MAYNPNKTYHNNRLSPVYGEPVMSDIAKPETNPAPVAQSGLGEAKFNLPEWLKVTLAVLATAGGVVLALPTMGVTLPPVALAIAGGVVSIAAGLGVVSPGARKKE